MNLHLNFSATLDGLREMAACAVARAGVPEPRGLAQVVFATGEGTRSAGRGNGAEAHERPT